MKHQQILLFFVIFFLVSVIIPSAFAEINISNLKQAYNLGEDILPDIIINQPDTTRGFQTISIICDNYENEYYKVPVYIKDGSLVSTAPLVSFTQMMGKCHINAILENLDKVQVDNAVSSDFIISDLLESELISEEFTLNPSDNLVLAGTLYNVRREPINGRLTVFFNEQTFEFEITSNPFSFNITISQNIKSGTHELKLSFEDSSGNYEQKSISAIISQIPTSISIVQPKAEYIPYENISADIILLDQAGDKMEKEMNIQIVKQSENGILNNYFKNKGIISGSSLTASSFNLFLNNTIKPGDYKIVAEFEKIKNEQSFKVLEYKKISSKLDGEFIVIENIGNIEFKDKIAVDMISNNKTYRIQRHISLLPTEKYSIDLSEEMKENYYSIILPTGETLDNIHISDSRSPLKKSYTLFRSITGSKISYLTYSFFLVLILIIISISIFAVLRSKSRIKEKKVL